MSANDERRARPGHENCDYVHEGDDAYYDRSVNTLDGRRPIANRPRAWIVPFRPVVDAAADTNVYCSECDWNDYYCLCSAARLVGTEDDRDGSRYDRLEERRSRQTAVFGFGDRRIAATTAAQEEAPNERRDVVVGAETTGRSTPNDGGAGPEAEGGGTLAVDEGTDGANDPERWLSKAIGMAAAGSLQHSDGSDAGGPSHGRSRDDALDEEELLEWAADRDEGRVKVCCSWTAASESDEEDLRSNPSCWERRCCVWIRKTPRSPPPTDNEGCWKRKIVERQLKRGEALRKQWRTPLAPGILYSTKRYEETLKTAIDRCGKCLRTASADDDWIARAQAAVDLELLDEELTKAEADYAACKRLTQESEEEVRLWEERCLAATTRRGERELKRKRMDLAELLEAKKFRRC